MGCLIEQLRYKYRKIIEMNYTKKDERQEKQGVTPKTKRVSYLLGRVESKESHKSKAEIVNRYRHIVEKWEKPMVMSIKLLSVSAKELDEGIKYMFKSFQKVRKISEGYEKKFACVKTFECNFNPKEDTFSLCFHVIAPLVYFVDIDWLWTKIEHFNFCPVSLTWNEATNVKKTLEDMIEYSQKITVDPTTKPQGILPLVYVKMPQCIHIGNKRYKTVEHFGFELPKEENEKDDKTSIEIIFSDELNTWTFADNPTQKFTLFNSTGVLKDILKQSR